MTKCSLCSSISLRYMTKSAKNTFPLRHNHSQRDILPRSNIKYTLLQYKANINIITVCMHVCETGHIAYLSMKCHFSGFSPLMNCPDIVFMILCPITLSHPAKTQRYFLYVCVCVIPMYM